MEQYAKRQGGSLWNCSSFINNSLKTQEKEALQGNILQFFSLDTLKTMYGKKFEWKI